VHTQFIIKFHKNEAGFRFLFLNKDVLDSNLEESS
jgi:hypothetical protein